MFSSLPGTMCSDSWHCGVCKITELQFVVHGKRVIVSAFFSFFDKCKSLIQPREITRVKAQTTIGDGSLTNTINQNNTIRQ